MAKVTAVDSTVTGAQYSRVCSVFVCPIFPQPHTTRFRRLTYTETWGYKVIKLVINLRNYIDALCRVVYMRARVSYRSSISPLLPGTIAVGSILPQHYYTIFYHYTVAQFHCSSCSGSICLIYHFPGPLHPSVCKDESSAISSYRFSYIFISSRPCLLNNTTGVRH